MSQYRFYSLLVLSIVTAAIGARINPNTVAGEIFSDKDSSTKTTTSCMACQQHEYMGNQKWVKCKDTMNPMDKRCDVVASGYECEENHGDCTGELLIWNNQNDCQTKPDNPDATETDYCSFVAAGAATFYYTDVTPP